MKAFIKRATIFLIMIIVLQNFQVFGLGSTNYVIDNDGQTHIPIPLSYTVGQVIDRVDNKDFFKSPQNMYIDSLDNIYIADSGNNRIVKMDEFGELIKIYTAGGALNAPSGVFSDNENNIYIADTVNERIVVVDEKDKIIREYKKPESELLDENLRFSANNIVKTNQGYLYILRGQHFMTVDLEGEFKGYVGSNEIGFDLKQFFIRTFASSEQKKKLPKPQPSSYNNFCLGADGFIYAVAAKQSSQIVKLNVVGENIFPSGFYGEQTIDATGKLVSPSFTSIAVDKDGFISVLEKNSKQIYQYDQEGTLLNVFGGSGNIFGKFETPISIAVNSKGNIYVVDNGRNNIQVFSRTLFSSLIYEAADLYGKGDYEGAYNLWEQVLEIDINYPVANVGIAKSLHKKGDIETAMAKYKLAENRAGYGQVLIDYRYNFIKQNFTAVALISFLSVLLIVFVFMKLKKYSDNIIKKYYGKEGKKQ